ncbi:MAG: 16S rRNA (guanine(966)-N(2))-methyltransferase RsmD [Caldisericia bacterium]
MRITSGELKGRKIIEVKDKKVRETLDRVRESLFNSLRGNIENKIFYDLYAGSGAVGIEALSNGAKLSIFVDKSIYSIRAIYENLKNLDLLNRAKIVRMDIIRFLKTKELEKGDFIFLDPPYEFELGTKTLEILNLSNIMKEETIIIYEHSKREIVKNNFEIYKSLKIGDTIIDFLRRRI